jgi:double-stranded uracil-DNA glycosylase
MAAKKDPILPDMLRPGLRLVFCGTAAGTKSALQRAYYANTQNRFWPMLHETGLTPHRFAAKDFADLWNYDIGLTDIAKYAYGMDHQLPKGSLGRAAIDALRDRIMKIAPLHLAFTSLKAGRSALGKGAIAGQQNVRWGQTAIWILPSPSPLASNHWNDKHWHDLANAVNAKR